MVSFSLPMYVRSYNSWNFIISLFSIKLSEVSPDKRQELFLKKLNQCSVIFDFNDASADLKGKEIKRSTLAELLEYITTNRGVITDPIYPEVVSMVCYSFLYI